MPLLLIMLVPLLIVSIASSLAPRSAWDSNSWVNHAIWIAALVCGLFAVLTGYLLFTLHTSVQALVSFAPRPKARAIIVGLYGVGAVAMAIGQLSHLVDGSTIILFFAVWPFVVALVWLAWRVANPQA